MARRMGKRTKETFLKCPECDNVVTIHRRRSKLKVKNHIKDLYCYKCKDTTKHIELKEDLFLPEWLREEDA